MEDQTHLKKYMKVLDKIPKVKYFVLWKDKVPEHLPAMMEGKVFTWQQFLEIGQKNYKPMKKQD